MVKITRRDVVNDTVFDEIAIGTIFYDFETEGVCIKINDGGALHLETGTYNTFSLKKVVAEIDVEIIWDFAKPKTKKR